MPSSPKIYHPLSNQARTLKALEAAKVCPNAGSCSDPDHVLNPASCRCVNINSPLGKIIKRFHGRREKRFKKQSSSPDDQQPVIMIENDVEPIQNYEGDMFPAYADKEFRDQLRLVTEKMAENNEKLGDVVSRSDQQIEASNQKVAGYENIREQVAFLSQKMQEQESNTQNLAIFDQFREQIALMSQKMEENGEKIANFVSSSITRLNEKLENFEKDVNEKLMPSNFSERMEKLEDVIRNMEKNIDAVNESLRDHKNEMKDGFSNFSSNVRADYESLKESTFIKMHGMELAIQNIKDATTQSSHQIGEKLFQIQENIEHHNEAAENSLKQSAISLSDEMEKALRGIQSDGIKSFIKASESAEKHLMELKDQIEKEEYLRMKGLITETEQKEEAIVARIKTAEENLKEFERRENLMIEKSVNETEKISKELKSSVVMMVDDFQRLLDDKKMLTGPILSELHERIVQAAQTISSMDEHAAKLASVESNLQNQESRATHTMERVITAVEDLENRERDLTNSMESHLKLVGESVVNNKTEELKEISAALDQTQVAAMQAIGQTARIAEESITNAAEVARDSLSGVLQEHTNRLTNVAESAEEKLTEKSRNLVEEVSILTHRAAKEIEFEVNNSIDRIQNAEQSISRDVIANIDRVEISEENKIMDVIHSEENKIMDVIQSAKSMLSAMINESRQKENAFESTYVDAIRNLENAKTVASGEIVDTANREVGEMQQLATLELSKMEAEAKQVHNNVIDDLNALNKKEEQIAEFSQRGLNSVQEYSSMELERMKLLSENIHMKVIDDLNALNSNLKTTEQVIEQATHNVIADIQQYSAVELEKITNKSNDIHAVVNKDLEAINTRLVETERIMEQEADKKLSQIQDLAESTIRQMENRSVDLSNNMDTNIGTINRNMEFAEKLLKETAMREMENTEQHIIEAANIELAKVEKLSNEEMNLMKSQSVEIQKNVERDISVLDRAANIFMQNSEKIHGRVEEDLEMLKKNLNKSEQTITEMGEKVLTQNENVQNLLSSSSAVLERAVDVSSKLHSETEDAEELINQASKKASEISSDIVHMVGESAKDIIEEINMSADRKEEDLSELAQQLVDNMDNTKSITRLNRRNDDTEDQTGGGDSGGGGGNGEQQREEDQQIGIQYAESNSDAVGEIGYDQTAGHSEELPAHVPAELINHVSPKERVILSNAESDAVKIHNEILQADDQILKQKEAIQNLQQIADRDYKLAESLREEAQRLDLMRLNEIVRIKSIEKDFHKAEDYVNRHPNDDIAIANVERIYEAAQNELQSLENIEERQQQVEDNYNQARQAVIDESENLNESSNNLTALENNLDVLRNEESEANTLIRKATNVLMDENLQGQSNHLSSPHKLDRFDVDEGLRKLIGSDLPSDELDHQFTRVPPIYNNKRSSLNDGAHISGGMIGNNAFNAEQRREIERNAMRALISRKVLPLKSKLYKFVIEHVRKAANQGHAVQVNNELIRKIYKENFAK